VLVSKGHLDKRKLSEAYLLRNVFGLLELMRKSLIISVFFYSGTGFRRWRDLEITGYLKQGWSSRHFSRV